MGCPLRPPPPPATGWRRTGRTRTREQQQDAAARHRNSCRAVATQERLEAGHALVECLGTVGIRHMDRALA